MQDLSPIWGSAFAVYISVFRMETYVNLNPNPNWVCDAQCESSAATIYVNDNRPQELLIKTGAGRGKDKSTEQSKLN